MGASESKATSRNSKQVNKLRAKLLDKANKVVGERTGRIALVMDMLLDPATELSCIRSADYLGVQRIWRIDPLQNSSAIQDGIYRQSDPFLQTLPELLDVDNCSSRKECLVSLKASGFKVWAVVDPENLFRSRNNLKTQVIALDNPYLRVPPKVAIVVGQGGVASSEMEARADLRVFLPSRGFGSNLPPVAATQAVLQMLFSRCPEARGDLSVQHQEMLLSQWHNLSPQSEDLVFCDAANEFLEGEKLALDPSEFSALIWSSRTSADNNDPSRRGDPAAAKASPSSSPSTLRESGQGGGRDNLPLGSETTRERRRSIERPTWYDILGNLKLMLGDVEDHPASDASSRSAPVADSSSSSALLTGAVRTVSFKPVHPSCKTVPGPIRFSHYSVDSLTELKERHSNGFVSEVPEGLIQVRSESYLKNGQKIPGGRPICQFMGGDLFRTPNKVDHICRGLKLPEVPDGFSRPPKGFPSLLVINVQVPEYQPSMFGGARDGIGFSTCFYHAINYDLATPQSRGLLARFLKNGTEEDGRPTRERLKIIMHIANPEEALRTGGILQAEKTMLDSYNAKPVMAKPQVRFFEDEGKYLEVVIDVHSWKYLVRKVVVSAVNRFHLLKWDFTLVLQGNYEEELPEQILCAARMHYIPSSAGRQLPADWL